MFFIIVIIIVFIVFKILQWKKTAVKIDLDSITFFEGSLGSGKTTMLVNQAIKLFKSRVFRFKLFNLLNLCSFGLIKNNYLMPTLYSNFPIYINKKYGYSTVINVAVLNWEFKINQDSIVVLDEVGYLFPNEQKKTDNAFTFGLTWFRHGTNSVMLCASQSLSECNISFRRKVNRCYHLHNCKRFFFSISSVEVVPVIISEDINNIYTSNTDDKILEKYYFKYPKKNFNSRYGRNLYNLNKDKRILLSYDFTLLLKEMNLKNGDKWCDLIYKF